MTNNDMPFDHKPTTDNISTTKSPSKELCLSAPTKKMSTSKWQTKSIALGHPSAPTEQKSTPQWRLKSPALGHPSAPMEQKTTPQWQLKSPTSGQPSALMAMNKKSTPQWQTKLPASRQPSAPMVNKPTPKWRLAMPAPTAMQSTPIALIPMPNLFHSPSSPPAEDKTWPINLIEIIRAIKEIPPQCLTLPEFMFDLTFKADKKNYHEKIQGKPCSFIGGATQLDHGIWLDILGCWHPCKNLWAAPKLAPDVSNPDQRVGVASSTP
jgi:hypothetical protein